MSDLNGGWIKLWRKIEQNPIFQDSCLFHAFAFCLIRACHSGRDILTSQGEIHLEPGQFITGRHEASKILGFKSKMWDRKLKQLENLQILTRKVTKQFSIISVINWETYQSPLENNDQLNDPSMTNLRPTHDHKQELKNVKNLRNKNILPDEEWILKMKELYSWLDWDSINREMDAWLLNNPHRKKTRQFITNWLSKKQKDKPMEIKQKIAESKAGSQGIPDWIQDISRSKRVKP